jgi:formylglycine-generating enzyme required for sulfatase activity
MDVAGRAKGIARRGAALGIGLVVGACGRVELGSHAIGGDAAFDAGSVGSPSQGLSALPAVDAPAEHPSSSLPPSANSSAPWRGDASPGEAPASAQPGTGTGGTLADAATSSLSDTPPPSCRGASERCGRGSDSCCMTLPVAGATVAPPLDTAGTRAKVHVSSFYLDKYEVTTGRFRAFLSAYDAWHGQGHPALDAGRHPLVPGSGWRTSDDEQLPASAAALETLIRECNTAPLSTLDLPNASSTIPLNCVTWAEAAAFCAWDDARLPTFAEWYAAAAAGGFDRTYPWGDEPTPSRLYASYGCPLGLERPECNAAYVLPVGSHPDGAGYYHQEDLAGSMTEWLMGGSLGEFAAGCSDCVGPPVEPLRFWRGGSWVDDAQAMKNSYFTLAEKALRLPFLGLRCARDAP